MEDGNRRAYRISLAIGEAAASEMERLGGATIGDLMLAFDMARKAMLVAALDQCLLGGVINDALQREQVARMMEEAEGLLYGDQQGDD